MLTTEREIALALGEAVARRITPARFQLWFEGRSKFHCEGDHLTVGMPNRFLQEYVQKTYAEVVAAAAEEVLGRPVRVRFVIDPELFRAARQAEAVTEQFTYTEVDEPRQVGDLPHVQPRGAGCQPAELHRQVGDLPHAAGDSPAVKSAPPRKEPGDTLFPARVPRGRRWRALDDFVVGPCNRVAHASAQAVVDNPAVDVNPLVLHGPVGTGKTHLLEGVFLGLKKKQPAWRISFVTAEEFTNRFVQAMRLGKLAAFRKQFRDCDALLLDDLHFLASKRATQEEFLHTFDALHAEGKQLAVTCDVHPRLNEQFMPELVDRLLGGAVWGLVPPDFDTRLSLLRAKSVRPGHPPLGEEVILFLAEQLRGNVRELEGALHGIFHYSKVAARRIDRDLVREALGDLLRHSVRVIRVPDIDQAVCRVLGMAAGALQGNKRSWEFSHPRMVAMYLARKHTTAAYTEIGRHFGNRTHSTVVAAEKKVRQWLKDDGVLALGRVHIRVRDLVERVERALQP